MPLRDVPADNPTLQKHVNKRAPPQQRPPHRTMTPQQPTADQERSLQRQDEARRKSLRPIVSSENKAPPSREEAAALKMEVPDTRSKSKLAQVTHSESPRRAEGPQPNIYSRILPPTGNEYNAFDETQSLHLDDSMSALLEREGLFQFSYNPVQERNTPHLQHAPAFATAGDLYLQGHGAERDTEEEMDIPEDWRREADAERVRQGVNPVHTTYAAHNVQSDSQAGEDHDEAPEQDGGVDEQSFLQNTPSRTSLILERRPLSKGRAEAATKVLKFQEPGQGASIKHRKSLSNIEQKIPVQVSLRQQPDRFHVRKPHEMKLKTERSRSPERQIHAPQPVLPQGLPAAFHSKGSSLHESSSEEDRPVQPRVVQSPQPQLGTKRPHPSHEVDLDPEDLQKTTVAELDKIRFPKDPRLPTPPPAVDSNGTPLSFSGKLHNLSKMRPEDQSMLFKSLTDTEREQTADWFLDKFRTEMQALMDVRIERRKIALKFEMEVRQRDRQVQTKRQDVEHELSELKKGGDELVKARSPSK